MPNQVQYGQLVKAQAAFEHHEAHLRDRGPRQANLDADARQHDEAGQQRGAEPEYHQQPAGDRRRFQ